MSVVLRSPVRAAAMLAIVAVAAQVVAGAKVVVQRPLLVAAQLLLRVVAHRHQTGNAKAAVAHC